MAEAVCNELTITPIPISLSCWKEQDRESGIKLSLGRKGLGRKFKICCTSDYPDYLILIGNKLISSVQGCPDSKW